MYRQEDAFMPFRASLAEGWSTYLWRMYLISRAYVHVELTSFTTRKRPFISYRWRTSMALGTEDLSFSSTILRKARCQAATLNAQTGRHSPASAELAVLIFKQLHIGDIPNCNNENFARHYSSWRCQQL